MTAKEQLQKRHDEAAEKLKAVCQPKIEKHGRNACAKLICDNLGVSFQTVVNYTYGNAKDGFLTEAITKEFKSLKL